MPNKPTGYEGFTTKQINILKKLVREEIAIINGGAKNSSLERLTALYDISKKLQLTK